MSRTRLTRALAAVAIAVPATLVATVGHDVATAEPAHAYSWSYKHRGDFYDPMFVYRFSHHNVWYSPAGIRYCTDVHTEIPRWAFFLGPINRATGSHRC